MIHWNPGWLGSRFNVIIINISVKAYGENEWGSCFRNAEVRPTIMVYSVSSYAGLLAGINRYINDPPLSRLPLAGALSVMVNLVAAMLSLSQ